MSELWLYRCSPLNAWISVPQCRENAARCAKAMKAKIGSEQRLPALHLEHGCPGCPGVEVRSREEGHSPRLVVGLMAHRTPKPKVPRPKLSITRPARWVTAEFLAARYPLGVNEIHETLRGRVRPVMRKGRVFYLRVHAERALREAA